jgi:hypothetical protein
MPKLNKFIIGNRYGMVEIIDVFFDREKKKTFVILKCDCGELKKAYKTNAVRGDHKSCGCNRIKALTKHGLFKKDGPKIRPRSYTIWDNMLRRGNPKTVQANRAGIYKKLNSRFKLVCEEWYNYEIFLADMGEPPTAKHSLDRIDNNKGYSRDNCRWATHTEQMRNTSRNVWYKINGVRCCQAELHRMFNLGSAGRNKFKKASYKQKRKLLGLQEKDCFEVL